MKYLFIVALSILLGLGVGVGISLGEFGTDPPEATLAMGAGQLQNQPAGPPPSIVFKQTDFDFGDMEGGTVGTHVFVVTNEGPGTLEISPGQHGCKCTDARVSRGKIGPHESSEVTVEWRPSMLQGEFSNWASVLTNDPKHPSISFSIHGKIMPTFQVDPPQLLVGRMSPKESREIVANLLAFRQSEFEILSYQWSDKKSKQFFGLTYRPLSADELESSKASCGYQLTITLRPGLPLGSLTQSLLLKTTLKTESQVSLPLYGTVAPELAIAGPLNFNRDRNIINFGAIPQGTRASANLSLLLVGEKHDQVKVKVKSVTPPDLQVIVGDPRPLLGGRSTQIPLDIIVPETARPVALLGTAKENMGQIVLETNHPDYKEVRIFVQMAVTDKPSAP